MTTHNPNEAPDGSPAGPKLDGELLAIWRRRSALLWPGGPARGEVLPPWRVEEGKGGMYTVTAPDDEGEPVIVATDEGLAAIGAAVMNAWCAPGRGLAWDLTREDGSSAAGVEAVTGARVEIRHAPGALERYRVFQGLAGSPRGLSYVLEVGGPGLLARALLELEERLAAAEPGGAELGEAPPAERAPELLGNPASPLYVSAFEVEEVPEHIRSFWRDLAADPAAEWTFWWITRALERLETRDSGEGAGGEGADGEGETLVTVHCISCGQPVPVPYGRWLASRRTGYVCDRCDASFTQPPEAPGGAGGDGEESGEE